MTPAEGPLRGVRVLEFSFIYAAPFAGLHLADMGADVIKVEPPGGEPFRHSGAVVPGAGKAFNWVNRGKRSLVVDLTRPQGREVIHRLLPSADAVLTNFRPGVAERLGVDYETLERLRPNLVYAEITGFGSTGPLAERAATDIVATAYGGAVAMGGRVDAFGAPTRLGVNVADIPTGLAVTMGVVAALYHRALTGEGQRVSGALLRTVMAISGVDNMRDPVNDSVKATPLREELEAIRARGGSYEELVGARERRMGGIGVGSLGLYYGGYRASDGGIVLGCLTPHNRGAARRVLDVQGDDSDAPGFDVTDPASIAHLADIKEYIRRTVRSRAVAEWIERFDQAGVPVSEVHFPEELAEDPQGSMYMVDVEHETAGPQRMIGPIVELERTPLTVAGPAPVLGRHTDEILRGCGYSDEAIAELRSAEVVA